MSGSENSMKSKRSCSTRYAPTHAGVAVALARHPERRRAAGVARVEQVRVEELARPVDRMAELRGLGDAPVDARPRRLVAGASAVDQPGGAGRAQPGVVEVLEDGLAAPAQVRHVHVVDRVEERAHDPEGARGLERRAVLDVALLAAVVPVHRGDVVLAGPAPGGDRRGGHRRDRRERGHAVAHVGPALAQRRERRRAALLDREVEHVGLERVDDRQDELLGLGHYRRTRRPAYFSPSRRRLPKSSTTKPMSATNESGGTNTARAASSERGQVGVDGQEAGGGRVEPPPRALDEAAHRQSARERAQAGPATSPSTTPWPSSASDSREQERAEHRGEAEQRKVYRRARLAPRGVGGRASRRPARAPAPRPGRPATRGSSSRCRRSRCPRRRARAPPPSSGGRKGRTPVAPARPAPVPMSRKRLMSGSAGRYPAGA